MANPFAGCSLIAHDPTGRWVLPVPGYDVEAEKKESSSDELLDKLDRELIGLKPVKQRIREIADLLVDLAKGHLVNVTRDDLVGQYIADTARKTKEVLKRTRLP